MTDTHSSGDARTRATQLKERVYATFTGLAIVLVMAAETRHLTAQSATLTLFVGIAAISMAGLVSEIIAHVAEYRALPAKDELRTMMQVSSGALGSASAALIPLIGACFGWFPLAGALRASTIIYIVSLALIGYVGVRRARLPWWATLLTLSALTLLGGLVVALQLIAHH